MSEILDFVQSYWFETGSLFMQFAILATLIWIGRKALRAIQTAQEDADARRGVSFSAAICGQGGWSEGLPATWPEQAAARQRRPPDWRRMARWMQTAAGKGRETVID